MREKIISYKIQIGKKLAVAFLLLLALFGIWGDLGVQKIYGETTQTIRVGFFELPGFYEYDVNGNMTGYGVDYFKEIASHTDWNYEFVDVHTWVNAMEMLKKDEVDILAPSQITEERQKEYDFSTFSIGIEYGCLLALEDTDIVDRKSVV